MRGNSVTRIPVQICQLGNLEVLNIGANSITTLPAELGSLSNLKQLSLDPNRVYTATVILETALVNRNIAPSMRLDFILQQDLSTALISAVLQLMSRKMTGGIVWPAPALNP